MKQTFRHVNTGLESPEKIRIRAAGVSIGVSAVGSYPYFGLPRGTSSEATKARGFGIPADSNAFAAYSRVASNSNPRIVGRKAKDKKA